MSNSKPGCAVSDLQLVWNRYHQWLSDIELNQIRAFSASYLSINPRFTARKRMGFWNCHTTCWHRRTTIFTSRVYGHNLQHLSMKQSWKYLCLSQFVSNKDMDEQQNDESLAKVKGSFVKCRICRGDHWSASCPYKDKLGEGASLAGAVKPKVRIFFFFFCCKGSLPPLLFFPAENPSFTSWSFRES
jgi:hypothetical protein